MAAKRTLSSQPAARSPPARGWHTATVRVTEAGVEKRSFAATVRHHDPPPWLPEMTSGRVAPRPIAVSLSMALQPFWEHMAADAVLEIEGRRYTVARVKDRNGVLEVDCYAEQATG